MLNVCFISDGISDAIAMRQAELSISLRGATTVATDTAQVILMKGNLNQLLYLFQLGRDFAHDLKRNVRFTTGVSAVAVSGILLAGFTFMVLVSVSLLVFIMVELLPGDAATAYLGRDATPEEVAQMRMALGLDRPAPERFLVWAGDLVRGDLGVSLARQEPIHSFLWMRLRNSLVLGITAALVGFPLAIGLGIIAGLTRDRLPDLLISTLSLIGMSLPEFVTATLLIYLFSIQWRLFPAVTLVNPDAPVADLLPNIVLPVLTLIILLTAYILRVVRTSIIDVMRSDYIRVARMKGLTRFWVVLRHALPNALLPTLTIAALTIAWLIGGLFVIEKVFNYPRIGTLLLTAIHDRDLPVVQSIAMVMVVIYVIVNLGADRFTLVLNPRLRSLRTAD